MLFTLSQPPLVPNSEIDCQDSYIDRREKTLKIILYKRIWESTVFFVSASITDHTGRGR